MDKTNPQNSLHLKKTPLTRVLSIILIQSLIFPPSLPAAQPQESKTSLLRSVSIYKAAQQVEEPKKVTEVQSTTSFLQQQTFLDLFRPNRKREEFRKELLVKTDGELKKTESKLTELNTALAETKVRLNEIIEQEQNNINQSVEALKVTMNSLTEILKEDGLSDETKQTIEAYLKRMNTYLTSESSDGLKAETKQFIDSLTISMLSPLELEIQSWKDYAKALTIYRDDILEAKTYYELERLSKQFPNRVEPPVMGMPIFSSPAGKLYQYKKEGDALYEQAKEELSGYEDRVRAALLKQVDSEVNLTNVELTELNKALLEAKVKLEELVKTLNSDIATQVEILKMLMTDLSSVVDQPGVTDETKKAVQDYLNQVGGYLDSDLKNHTNSYIHFLTLTTVSFIEIEIQSWNQYLSALETYREKVVNAKTLEELTLLQDQFPVHVGGPMPLIAAVSSPVESLKKYIEDARALIEKVKNESEPYQRISALVANDLVVSFGLPQEVVDEVIKEGLIKIKVDPKTLQAVVSIDPSIRLPEGALYFADPIGIRKLPSVINYQLGDGPQIMAPCVMDADGMSVCPPHVYQLESANFELKGHYYQLNYLSANIDILPQFGDNRIHGVKIYDGNPDIVCITTPCPTGKLITEIAYQYKEDNSILAQMTYHEASQGEVVSRLVQIKMMEDNKHHLLSAIDRDKMNNVIAENNFKYAVAMPLCAAGSICSAQVFLIEVNRTDVDGKPLSKIHNIRFAPTIAVVGAVPAYEATVTLPNGKETTVVFQAIEELFVQVLRIESDNDSVEQFRKELLLQIESEKTLGNAKVAELTQALEEAKAKLDELINTLNSDIVTRVETLGSLSTALNLIIENPAVTEETKQAIQDYLGQVNAYLNAGGLENQTNAYINYLTMTTVSVIEAQLESWSSYLIALNLYHEQVLSAQTLEELEILKSQFPIRISPPMPLIAAVISPVITLDQMIEAGNVLLARAKEEINRKTNEPPVLAPISNQVMAEDAINLVDLSGSDPDGDTLFYRLIDGPSFASIILNDDGTSTLKLEPTQGAEGNYLLTVAVSDRNDLNDPEHFETKESFMLEITPVVPFYRVGVNYHATAEDFANSSFISQYHNSAVRATVLEQLQGMADAGAQIIKTALWMVKNPGATPPETWKLNFPLSAQDLANIRQYVLDIAAIQAADGHRLQLEMTLLWLGAADFKMEANAQAGCGAGQYGWSCLSWDQLIDRAKQTVTNFFSAVGDIKRPDGKQAVSLVYLNGEVAVGATKNEDRFLRDLYSFFIEKAEAVGIKPSLYFIAVPHEDVILDDDYVDAQFSILNGHRPLYWIYRSINFLRQNNLRVPERIDFSFYPQVVNSDYSTLVTHVMEDMAAVFPDHKIGIAETLYPVDEGARFDIGQAFGNQFLNQAPLEHVIFWSTPSGIGAGGSRVDVAYPFDFLSYYPDREKEILRKELLAQIESERNLANTKVTELTQALEEAKVKLAELIETLNSDIVVRTEQLSSLSIALNLIIENPVVTDETKMAIQTYLQQVNAYLNAGGLENQTSAYINYLTLDTISYIEAQLESWNGYLIALGIYHESVLSAQTLKELEALKAQFPMRQEPPQFIPPAVISPVIILDQMIEQGNVLLAKANEEIHNEATERAKLLAYIQSVTDAQLEYIESVKGQWQQVTTLHPVLTLEELRALGATERQINLHLYFQMMESASQNYLASTGYYVDISQFPSEIRTPEGSELAPWFNDFITQEGLPGLSVLALFETGGTDGLSLEELKAAVDQIYAVVGDSPSAFYQTKAAENQTYLNTVMSALNKINEEFSLLMNSRPHVSDPAMTNPEDKFGLFNAGTSTDLMDELDSHATRPFYRFDGQSQQALEYIVAQQNSDNLLVMTLIPNGEGWENQIVADLREQGIGGAASNGLTGFPEDIEAYKQALRDFIESVDGDGINDMAGLQDPITHFSVTNEPKWQWYGDVNESDAASIQTLGLTEWRKQNWERLSRSYGEFMKMTAETIWETNPEMQVIMGDIFSLENGSGPGNKIVLEEYKDYYDAIDVHIYTNHVDLQAKLNGLNQLFAAAGVTDKPVWSLEFGGPMKTEVFTEAELAIHAQEVVKMQIMALEAGFDKIFWANLLPLAGYEPGFFNNLALVGPDADGNLYKKPAYYTYQLLEQKVNGYDSIEKVAGDFNQYKVTFNDAPETWILWNDGGSKTVDVSSQVGSEYVKITRIVTQLGQSVPVTEIVRADQVVIDKNPVFIEETQQTAINYTVDFGASLITQTSVRFQATIDPMPTTSTTVRVVYRVSGTDTWSYVDMAVNPKKEDNEYLLKVLGLTSNTSYQYYIEVLEDGAVVTRTAVSSFKTLA